MVDKSEYNRKTKDSSGFDRDMEEVSQMPVRAIKLVAQKESA